MEFNFRKRGHEWPSIKNGEIRRPTNEGKRPTQAFNRSLQSSQSRFVPHFPSLRPCARASACIDRPPPFTPLPYTSTANSIVGRIQIADTADAIMRYIYIPRTLQPLDCDTLRNLQSERYCLAIYTGAARDTSPFWALCGAQNRRG